MSLTDVYPLIPTFPDYGEHHALVWWTESEQHHAIVTKSVAGIIRILQILLDRQPCRHRPEEIRSYWKANIVPPPNWAQQKWAEQCYKKERAEFRGWFLTLAKDYQEARERPPQGFEPCREYKPPEDYLDEDDDYLRSWAIEHHSSCLHCDGDKIVPVKFTWDDLFLGLRDEFRAVRPRTAPCTPSEPPEEVRDTTPTHIAILEAGHHCRGFTVMSVSNWSKDPWRMTYPPPLFFFVGEKLPIPDEIQDHWDTFHAEERKKAAAASIDAEAKWRAKQETNADDLDKLMGRFS